MVYSRLQRLVLETLTPNLLPELRNKPLEELFYFAPTTNKTQEVAALTALHLIQCILITSYSMPKTVTSI
jgi:hypothetical protein